MRDMLLSVRDLDLETRFFQIRDRCLTVLRGLFALAIPLTIVNIWFACIYAWIYANQYSYDKNTWQRCLVHPNQGGFDKQGNPLEDKTNFLMAAATYAGRVFIFIIIVFKVAYVGIKDTDVLPYAIFTNVMALLSITIYREAEPIQPQPEQISATLFTLTKYIKPDMYHFGASSAPQHCQPAYSLNQGFLISQYLVVVVVVCVLSVVLACFAANFRLGKRWNFQLKGNAIPLVLLVVAFGGYLTCFIAKETVAQLTLDVLRDSGLQSIFPFRKGELDIVSLTMMMTLGAIGIGTCKGDLEKFKLGAFVAYVHVVLSYPSILGTLHAYDSITFPYVSKGGKPYDIWHDCPSYLRIKAGDLFANYPEQTATLCQMVHVSLMGQMVQFVAQHLVVVSCLYILWANRDLPAQRMLRLGSYVPDYLDNARVHMSVNEPMDGFYTDRLNSVRSGREGGIRYKLLPDFVTSPPASS